MLERKELKRKALKQIENSLINHGKAEKERERERDYLLIEWLF